MAAFGPTNGRPGCAPMLAVLPPPRHSQRTTQPVPRLQIPSPLMGEGWDGGEPQTRQHSLVGMSLVGARQPPYHPSVYPCSREEPALVKTGREPTPSLPDVTSLPLPKLLPPLLPSLHEKLPSPSLRCPRGCGDPSPHPERHHPFPQFSPPTCHFEHSAAASTNLTAGSHLSYLLSPPPPSRVLAHAGTHRPAVRGPGEWRPLSSRMRGPIPSPTQGLPREGVCLKTTIRPPTFFETNLTPETNALRHGFDFTNESRPRLETRKRIHQPPRRKNHE